MGCRRSACCDGRLGRGALITMAAQPQAKSAVSKAFMDFYPEICVTVVLQQKLPTQYRCPLRVLFLSYQYLKKRYTSDYD